MSRKIGALWLREAKGGKKYMSGIIEDLTGDIQIVVFRNEKKEKDTQPDFQILLSEKKPERRPAGGGDDFMGGFNDNPQPVKVDTGEIPVVEEKPGETTLGGDDEIDVRDIPF